MTTEPIVEQGPAGEPVGVVTDEQLVDRARSDGLNLIGEGGLLQQLTKQVVESALEGEIADHVGQYTGAGGDADAGVVLAGGAAVPGVDAFVADRGVE